MATQLKVTLKLHHIRADEYGATVTTQATDTCYKAKSIRLGLPKGKVGLPEIAFITAELSHDGGVCGDLVHDIAQKIEGISSGGHPQGVTAFVTVNDSVAGETHQPFPQK
jgi:hypothetical protein